MIKLRVKIMKWLAGNDIAMIVNIDAIEGCIHIRKPVALYNYADLIPLPSQFKVTDISKCDNFGGGSGGV